MKTQKLHKALKQAQELNNPEILSRIQKLVALHEAKTTVATITDTALEKAIKSVIKFTTNSALDAKADMSDGDVEGLTKNIELMLAGLDLVSTLTELISEA